MTISAKNIWGNKIKSLAILFLACASCFGFGFISSAHAATFAYDTCDGDTCLYYTVNASLDKSTYAAGYDPMKATIDVQEQDPDYETVTTVNGGAGTVVATYVTHHIEPGYGPSASLSTIQDDYSIYNSTYTGAFAPFVSETGYGPQYDLHFGVNQSHFLNDPSYTGYTLDPDGVEYADPYLNIVAPGVVPRNAWTLNSSTNTTTYKSGGTTVVYYNGDTEADITNYTIYSAVPLGDPGQYFQPLGFDDAFVVSSSELGASSGSGGEGASNQAPDVSERGITILLPFTLTVPDTQVQITNVTCNSVSGYVYDSNNPHQYYSVGVIPPYDGDWIYFPPEDGTYQQLFTQLYSDPTPHPLTNGFMTKGWGVYTLAAGERSGGAFTIPLSGLTSTDGAFTNINLSNPYSEPTAATLVVSALESFQNPIHSYTYQYNNEYNDAADGNPNVIVWDDGYVYLTNTSSTWSQTSWANFPNSASIATLVNSITSGLGHALYDNDQSVPSPYQDPSYLFGGFPQVIGYATDPNEDSNLYNLSFSGVTLPVCGATTPSASITASPTVVNYGDPVSISWTSENATTCVASNSNGNSLNPNLYSANTGTWVGTRAASGTESMDTTNMYLQGPQSQVTLNVDCGNGTATSSASTQVTVNNVPEVDVCPYIDGVIDPTVQASVPDGMTLESGGCFHQAQIFMYANPSSFAANTMNDPVEVAGNVSYATACKPSSIPAGNTSWWHSWTNNPVQDTYSESSGVANTTVSASTKFILTCTGLDGNPVAQNTTVNVGDAPTPDFTLTCGNSPVDLSSTQFNEPIQANPTGEFTDMIDISAGGSTLPNGTTFALTPSTPAINCQSGSCPPVNPLTVTLSQALPSNGTLYSVDIVGTDPQTGDTHACTVGLQAPAAPKPSGSGAVYKEI